MTRVFGRNKYGVSVYDRTLSEWAGSPDVALRALACNIMFDSRVSPRRETWIYRYVRQKGNLDDALVAYFKNKVGTAKHPHFVLRSLNGHNLVRHRTIPNPQVKDDDLLARVLVLNGLGLPFQWALGAGWDAALRGFDPSSTEEDKAKWLGEKLDTDPVPFITAALDIMDSHRRTKESYQPTWAVKWSEFETHAGRDPGHWLDVVGKRRESVDRWCIVLVYPARSAPTLARPSMLDTNRYPYHMPSPNWVKPARGGHPLDLDDARAPLPLLTEYIHNEIKHTIDHWENGGRKIGTAKAHTQTDLDNEDLGALRARHLKLLAERYDATRVRGWMPHAT